MNITFSELMALALFFIGIYGIIARRNIIKTIVSLGIIQSSIILFFLTVNYDINKLPPIGVSDSSATVDAFPQALMITTIVLGVSVTAVTLVMFMNLYHHYGTTNWQKVIEKRKEFDNE